MCGSSAELNLASKEEREQKEQSRRGKEEGRSRRDCGSRLKYGARKRDNILTTGFTGEWMLGFTDGSWGRSYGTPL